MQAIVLDTNCLVQIVSHNSKLYPIWQNFLSGKYRLCVTTEILEEYEEILGHLMSPEIARIVVEVIVKHPLTRLIDPYIHFDLIKADPDDNKFVDCAIAANANYVVSEDSHFKELKSISFPKVEVIRLKEFASLLGCLPN